MSNISQDEINKFDQSDWWDPKGSFRTLHDINPTRFEFITEFAELVGKKALDVGCGGGIITEGLAKRGAITSAIDMAPEAIKIAKEHALSMNFTIDYQLSTVEDLAAQFPLHFDVITCLEMLEHVPNPASIINACAALLKPNGKIFFSTINRSFKAKNLALFMAESVFKIIPKGTHDYDKLITPLELYELCESAGLSVKKIQGMHYNPFTYTAFLNDDVSINYLLFATKETKETKEVNEAKEIKKVKEVKEKKK